MLGRAEARVMASAGLLLLALSAVAMKWPRVAAVPLSLLLGWIALALLFRSATLTFRDTTSRWP